MTNIIHYNFKRPLVTQYYCNVEACALEDGSVWYRLQDVKTGRFGDWIKIEEG